MNRVVRLTAKDFRCIEAIDQTIAAKGAIVKGRNGGGKTTVLAAIHAALTGRGISPDAVRLGADRAEITVDLGDNTVRRLIPRDGRSTVVVKDAGGITRQSPQSWLDDLIGPSLDPLDLYHAEPKARRAKILAALPIAVTREQLVAWIPDLAEGADVSGHGLEVIARLRAHYYEQRKAANATAKSLRAEADRKQAAVPASAPGAEPVIDAEETLREAAAHLAALEAQDEQARKAIERTAGTRAQIASLRRQVTDIDVADARNVLATATNDADDATSEIATLETQLAAARKKLSNARGDMAQATENLRRAESLSGQANALEAALANAGPDPVDAERLDDAQRTVAQAQEDLGRSRNAERAEAAAADAATASGAAERAERDAERLDKIVNALTDDAPKALLAQSNGIEGLALEGDEITLDNVRLDGLCGMEALRFATTIAKRANAGRGLKLLVVDGMERLDPEQLDAFVEMATADGFQLLGTRVDRGDVVIEAIESADDAPAAKLAAPREKRPDFAADPDAWTAYLASLPSNEETIAAYHKHSGAFRRANVRDARRAATIADLVRRGLTADAAEKVMAR